MRACVRARSLMSRMSAKVYRVCVCVCVCRGGGGCFQVSLRKQEIGDRLNAWMMFKEKNAELCDWLTRMENKMADASQLNIEEMVEKLKKVRARSGRSAVCRWPRLRASSRVLSCASLPCGAALDFPLTFVSRARSAKLTA